MERKDDNKNGEVGDLPTMPLSSAPRAHRHMMDNANQVSFIRMVPIGSVRYQEEKRCLAWVKPDIGVRGGQLDKRCILRKVILILFLCMHIGQLGGAMACGEERWEGGAGVWGREGDGVVCKGKEIRGKIVTMQLGSKALKY
jgi:hypothetical protein